MKTMKMLPSGNVQFLTEEAMNSWVKGFETTMSKESK